MTRNNRFKVFLAGLLIGTFSGLIAGFLIWRKKNESIKEEIQASNNNTLNLINTNFDKLESTVKKISDAFNAGRKSVQKPAESEE